MNFLKTPVSRKASAGKLMAKMMNSSHAKGVAMGILKYLREARR